jgi:glycosyltransferase involved in cell wall biosynthesis
VRHDATRDALEALDCADRVEPVARGHSPVRSVLWQHTRMGAALRSRRVDVLVGINHFALNASCPQIVYHLNLRRFSRQYRSWRPRALVHEWVRDRLAQLALRRAAANIFESQFLLDAAQSCSRQAPHNPHVIYAGLPKDLAVPLLTHADPGLNSRRIVSITTHLEHKDNPTLLRMLAELVRRQPEQPWRLDIAGGVNLHQWEPARKLAAELGVLERVAWHGYCDVEKLTNLLRDSLCLVSTSQLESFAMVAIEAMARGCPPIVADCASMPESVGDGGLLATPGDAASFAGAVQRLTDETNLRSDLIERGRQWIKQFHWTECGRQFAAAIAQAAGQSLSVRALAG